MAIETIFGYMLIGPIKTEIVITNAISMFIVNEIGLDQLVHTMKFVYRKAADKNKSEIKRN